jgi:hypothetical protein
MPSPTFAHSSCNPWLTNCLLVAVDGLKPFGKGRGWTTNPLGNLVTAMAIPPEKAAIQSSGDLNGRIQPDSRRRSIVLSSGKICAVKIVIRSPMIAKAHTATKSVFLSEKNMLETTLPEGL